MGTPQDRVQEEVDELMKHLDSLMCLGIDDDIIETLQECSAVIKDKVTEYLNVRQDLTRTVNQLTGRNFDIPKTIYD